jgi:hypothetical protein
VINSLVVEGSHQQYLTSFIREEDLKLPALYKSSNMPSGAIEDGSALEGEEDTEDEEEDTEDEEEDSDDNLLFSIINALNENKVQQPKSIFTPPPASDVGIKCFNRQQKPLLSSSLSLSLSTTQTYSPQLNLSLYSPSVITPISSIRSSTKRGYSNSPIIEAATAAAASTSFDSCLIGGNTISTATTTVQKKIAPTTATNIYNQNPSLTGSISFSTNPASIKMDIRSPPHPTQSSSRFMNAFQRFRNSATTSKGHLGSVAPAEISVKPSPSKSSLADKIKSKFQHKKRTSLLEQQAIITPQPQASDIYHNKRKSTALSQKPSFSMPRSASLSSITHQWTRNRSTTVAPAMPNNRKSLTKMSPSYSVTAIKTSASYSSFSSSTTSSYEAATAVTPTSPTFSLNKSISSHRLYNKTKETSAARPRQPLRAVNPNDFVRLSLQQQQKKKGNNKGVQFTKLVSVRETWSKQDYDRGSDPEAVCSRLTPAMAQQIKEELNAYKLHEMQVHEYSRAHTHFFL